MEKCTFVYNIRFNSPLRGLIKLLYCLYLLFFYFLIVFSLVIRCIQQFDNKAQIGFLNMLETIKKTEHLQNSELNLFLLLSVKELTWGEEN